MKAWIFMNKFGRPCVSHCDKSYDGKYSARSDASPLVGSIQMEENLTIGLTFLGNAFIVSCDSSFKTIFRLLASRSIW